MTFTNDQRRLLEEHDPVIVCRIAASPAETIEWLRSTHMGGTVSHKPWRDAGYWRQVDSSGLTIARWDHFAVNAPREVLCRITWRVLATWSAALPQALREAARAAAYPGTAEACRPIVQQMIAPAPATSHTEVHPCGYREQLRTGRCQLHGDRKPSPHLWGVALLIKTPTPHLHPWMHCPDEATARDRLEHQVAIQRPGQPLPVLVRRSDMADPWEIAETTPPAEPADLLELLALGVS